MLVQTFDDFLIEDRKFAEFVLKHVFDIATAGSIRRSFRRATTSLSCKSRKQVWLARFYSSDLALRLKLLSAGCRFLLLTASTTAACLT